MDTIIFGRHGIALRDLSPEMADAIAMEANHPEIAVYLRDVFPYPYAREDADAFIRFSLTSSAVRNLAIYSHDTFAGIIGLTFQHDIYRHSAEVGFWLGKRFHGRGIMTEAVRLVCHHAFDELNIVRLYACVFEPNVASKRILEKNGFRVEGVRRKAVVKNKQFFDDFFMAKLKDDDG